tara:strand:+ start:180 stop:497 length:318 start_codon:yes stop_codon:yes gene_type:complete
MTTYIWTIQSMPAYPQAKGQTDVVFQVNWQCNANDNVYSANTFGSVSVTYTVGSPFTLYADITQDQVWGWVNPQIDRPEIEANLQALIDAQKNPTDVTLTLPWRN